MITSLMFDEKCLLCEKSDSLALRYGLCHQCFSHLMFAHEDGKKCDVCGRRLISEDHICMRCRQESFAFASNSFFWEYSGDAKKIIGLYKFKDCRKLANFFALRLYRSLEDEYKKEKILIVVSPCSSGRVKKYGYNHIKKICDILEKNYYVAVFSGLSRKKGKQLKELGREERKAELNGKIFMKEKDAAVFRVMCQDSIVVFVDDIFTTGTTASVCSKVLIENGAEKVDVMTLALD